MEDTNDHKDPGTLVETLVEHEGSPVRISLAQSEATVPIEPYDGSSLRSETVSLDSFDAVIEFASLEDGGLTLLGMLHLSESEWTRTGFGTHWEHDDSVIDGEQRMIDVWAARDWDDGPESPFDFPELSIAVAKTLEGLRRGGGLDRLTVGTVEGIERLDDLDDWPEEREPLTVDAPPNEPRVTLTEATPLEPTEQVLEALYVVNKHAKRYADSAAQAYAAGDGAQARIHSIRKSALYSLKTVALHRIVKHEPTAVEFERHEIDGEPFVCLYIGGWAFHQPLESIDEELLDGLADDGTGRASETTIDYQRSSSVEHSDVSLTDALCHFDALEINANDFLNQTHVVDGWWNKRYAGWEVLRD